MHSRLLPMLAVVIVAVSSQARADFNFGSLAQYDLVVANNINNPTSETEGPALVGGNIGSSGSTNTMNFAQKLTSSYNGYNTLIVGGTIYSNNDNIGHGNVYVSTAANGNPSNPPQFNGTGGKVVTGLDTTNLSSNIQKALDSAETNLNALISDPKANTLVNPTQPSHVTLDASKVNANGVAIFNIAANLINNSAQGSNIQSLDLINETANSKIVINITGANGGSVTANIGLGGDFSASAAVNSNIIWNFGNASAVTLQTSLDGAVLAADAAVSNPSTLNGPLYASSWTPNGEIHLPYESAILGGGSLIYTGVGFTAPVPEPATVISTLSGLAIIGGAAWRRRRRRLA